MIETNKAPSPPDPSIVCHQGQPGLSSPFFGRSSPSSNMDSFEKNHFKKPEFPVLRITEPGDFEHVRITETKRTTTCITVSSEIKCEINKVINSFPEGNSRFCRPDIIKMSTLSETRRATTEVPLDAFNKKKLVVDERPKSVTSSSGPPSSCSSMSSGSLTSTTSSIPRSVCSDGPSPSVAYLASAESLANSCSDLKVPNIVEQPEPPSSSLTTSTSSECDWPTWPGRTSQVRSIRNEHNTQLRHSAESGDSGDSGLSLEGSNHELNRMNRVVSEIVETERIYVKDLGDIVQGYLRYWKDCTIDIPLSQEQITALFGNLETIWKFNRQLLNDLASCGLDPVRVAECFVKYSNGFTIYTDYCTNYPNAVSTLTEVVRNEKIVKSFRDRQTYLGHALPLGSYLLKPVQRILKYHLLFQNIIKMYDPTAADMNIILAASSAMTGIAQHTNDMKRRHEHSIRVQEIQSLLYGWTGQDLTTYGELVAEGMFRLCGARGLRHVFLFEKILLICKRKEDMTFVYKTHIMCSNLMLVESVPGEPLSFHVIPFDNPKTQFTLEARCLDQKRDWALQIKRVILENYQAVIPTHAKQILMEIGQAQKETTLERSTTKRHHVAPEYLQRRRMDRKNSREKKFQELRSTSPKDSPLLPRRLRRSLGVITRDRSESRDRDTDSESCSSRRLSDSEKPRENRFWRRKSEPSSSFFRSSSVQSDCNPPTIPEVSSNECLNTDSGITEDSALSDIPDSKSESVAELVGQLVLQNVEIQRVLRRRKKSNRFRLPDSAADTDGATDCESDIGPQARDEIESKNIFKRFGKILTREQVDNFMRNLSPQRKMSHIMNNINQRRSSKDKMVEVRRTRSFSISDINRIDPELSVDQAEQKSKIHASASLSDLQRHSVISRKSKRPVTIASHHTDDETDHSLNHQCSDSTSVGESVASSLNIPQYKIYRRSLSKTSLKNLMQNVGSKFSNLRSGSNDKFSVTPGVDECEESNAGKMVNILARQYSRVLKQRIKNIMGDTVPEKKDPGVGNPSAAARMASNDYSDYAIPSSLNIPKLDDDTDKSDSELSTGSIYERTFEEIESMLDSLRDSAVYSDRDDTLSVSSDNYLPPKVPPPVPPKSIKTPPPTKPKPQAKIAKEGLYPTPSLEGLKSISDRLKDLEHWRRENNKSSCDDESETSSQHSTSTVNTVLEVKAPSFEILDDKKDKLPTAQNALPKGWVRQVIGKIQGGVFD
ncbi:hypothetical protein QYM36_013293 [Artemia franciscana]|nr:hypothetical protein QYM36_013293 [Artemia franciscana]KAK2709569.1 hypothetical protein QYM36_013293 [Artemia franciscana]